MDFTWQTTALGAIQGLTEFLPVSSSGHLALLQTFFDFSKAGYTAGDLLAFDILLHCSTTLAVLLFFRKDVFSILTQWGRGFFSIEDRRSEGWRYGWSILAGTGATALVALPLKETVEGAMSSYLFIGAGFLVTAGILCLVPLAPQRQKEPSLAMGIAVGLTQGLAVFPGVSRSGTTLAMALFMGLSAPKAFRLSFLMSVPAVLGASFLETVEVLRNPAAAMPQGWLFAAFAALGLGFFSLALLRRLFLSGRWPYFGIYCFFLGLFAVVSDIAARF